MRKIFLALIGGFILIKTPVALAQFTFTTNNGGITITAYTAYDYYVTVPDTTNGLPVTAIGPSAFQRTVVWGVTLSTNLTCIGTNAFYQCESLQEVLIPNGVTNIEDNAFRNCYSLADAVLSTNLDSIGSAAFVSTALTNVIIPDSVTSIGSFAFAFSDLQNIQLSTNITSISNDMFEYCKSLTSVAIPLGVTNIGNSAFDQCSSLTNITIPDSVTTIGPGAFAECTSLTNIDIPGSATYFGNAQYFGDAAIPTGTTNLKAWMYYDCPYLGEVSIPDTVSFIGYAAFALNPNLTSFVFSTNVTTISPYAFFQTGLASVYFPAGVTNIGIGAFAGCGNLLAINVDPQNPAYSSLDGVLFNKDQTVLLQFPGGRSGNYTIPDSVTYISGEAFACSPYLTSVTIGDGVTNIGYNGEGYDNANDYGLPGFALADGAFQNCDSLTNVVIGRDVTNIGFESFAFCPNLASVFFLGIPPSGPGEESFQGEIPTMYSMYDTTAWEGNLGGFPSVIWGAAIQTTDGRLGERNHQFGFNVTGATNTQFVVQVCTTLVNPAWTPLLTNTLGTNAFYFSEPVQLNAPARYFRLYLPLPF